MTTTQQQILDELIRLLKDADKWAFVSQYRNSDGWMKRGALYIKAFEKIGPRDPWKYMIVVVEPNEWSIPSAYRSALWEKAYPVFEQVRQRSAESPTSDILRVLQGAS
jgi:hypothetical protein